MPIDGRSIGITFGIDVAIAAGAFTAFGLLRSHPYTKRFFAPKFYGRRTGEKPRAVPKSPKGFFEVLWGYTEADVIAVAGADAATYLRVISFGLSVFSWLLLWGIAVILPVNYVGDVVDTLMRYQPEPLPVGSQTAGHRPAPFGCRLTLPCIRPYT